MELMTLNNLMAVLRDFAADISRDYKARIAERGKDASGALSRSADNWTIRATNDRYEIVFRLEDYWKYVERGSRGTESSPAGALGKAHWPPASALQRWIEIKPILPHPDARGKIPTTKQLAFLIGRKIYTEGIAPAPMMTEAIASERPRYEQLIKQALYRDTTTYINSLMMDAFSGFRK